MAKKGKKKGAKKAPGRASKPAAKKGAKRTVRKAGGGRRAARGAAKAGGPNPAPVSTGSGASAMEIGQDLVTMFNAGQLAEIEKKWWSPRITSVEGVGVAMAWSGREAVEEKNRGWMETHALHGASAEGPFVGASGFAVKYRMDVEDKTNGKRETMEEVGVYTVEDGKIVREEFMYRVGGA